MKPDELSGLQPEWILLRDGAAELSVYLMIYCDSPTIYSCCFCESSVIQPTI